MSPPPRKRPLPFVTLPQHRQRSEVISLKSKIHRDTALYGGRFTRWLVLNDLGHPDLSDQWFDFYFLGTDRYTIWNATLVSARHAYWHLVSEIAHTHVEAMLTPDEIDENFKVVSARGPRSSSVKDFPYKLSLGDEKRFEKFDGLTFVEQCYKVAVEIAREEPPEIHESCKVDRSSVGGVGLEIVLDVNVINQVSIEAAIDHFISVGEANWVSPKPVPRDRLPAIY